MAEQFQHSVGLYDCSEQQATGRPLPITPCLVIFGQDGDYIGLHYSFDDNYGGVLNGYHPFFIGLHFLQWLQTVQIPP
jgi:hypothetical protein